MIATVPFVRNRCPGVRASVVITRTAAPPLTVGGGSGGSSSSWMAPVIPMDAWLVACLYPLIGRVTTAAIIGFAVKSVAPFGVTDGTSGTPGTRNVHRLIDL